jgi:hypothetical protein
MKTKKLNAVHVWKQTEDLLIPQLHLDLVERAVYYHLLRHSHLEGKPRFCFSIYWLARSARISGWVARRAVRVSAARAGTVSTARAGSAPKRAASTMSCPKPAWAAIPTATWFRAAENATRSRPTAVPRTSSAGSSARAV